MSILKKLKHLLPWRKGKSNQAIDLIDPQTEDIAPWWGTFLVTDSQSRYLKIGQIVLCIDHYNQEWRIACRDEARNVNSPLKIMSVHSLTTEIMVKPVLPNRPLLTTLERPLFIPGGEESLLFVSTPAWIQLSIGSPPLILDEIPTEILSDTWFGKNTLEGELCFAGFPASARLDELNRDITQIMTPVLIKNDNRDPLVLKQLKLPLPQLSVYHDAYHHLWTEQVQIAFEDEIIGTTLMRNGLNKLKELTLLSTSRLGTKPRFSLFGSLRMFI